VHERSGSGPYRRSVPLDPRLLHAAEALVADLRYTGLIMVEFRINVETDDWALIETNGRFWGSLPLAVAAGVDFPRYLYEMLIEGRTTFPKFYKSGTYCRNLTMDLQWLKQNLKADRSDSTESVVPLRRVLFEFRNILKLAEHIDTFALDDPVPFFIELRQLAKRGALYALQKAGHFSGLTALAKRHRRAKALHKINAARSVTFVCYGNICRSPFAEGYSRTVAPNHMTFRSAGVYRKTGRSVPNEAARAAAKHGIDLLSHRSQMLTTETVGTSDLLVIFDRANWRDILLQFPYAKSRVVRLGDFLDGSDEEIADPFGQSLAHFEDCYKKIASAILRISHLWASQTDRTTA
jgi:protein-tyrosine-phosphatase